jgi:(p)ppGpp synthase/HD superfamily hydrolase
MDEASLMIAIARGTVSDAAVMEALMPGSAGGEHQHQVPAQRQAVSIKGLTPGVAFDLAVCCHPVPGDRIVGLRRPDEAIQVHTIDCPKLIDGNDADWVDLAWGDKSDGGTARLSVVIRNEPGALAVMSGIFGTHKANILNLRLVNRDGAFHTFEVDLEVHDLHHLMRILAALRAADVVASAERVQAG